MKNNLQKWQTKKYMAMGFVLLAAFSFAGMNAFSKLAQDHTNFSMILFFRFSIALLVLLPLISLQGGWQQLKTTKPLWHLMRAICGFSALACAVIACKYIPLADVILLNITYPLFTPMLLLICCRQRISFYTFIGLVVGFIGVIVTLNLDPNYLIDPGALFALASGLFTALAIVLTKQMSSTETIQAIGFYLFGFSVLVSFILIIFNWETPTSLLVLSLLFGVGITGLIYQQAISYALTLLDTNLVTTLMYTSIIFGGLLGWLIWSQVPTIYTWLGSSLILVGSLLVLNACRKNNK